MIYRCRLPEISNANLPVRARSFWLCLAICYALLGWQPVVAQATEPVLKRSQRVVVVVCKYQGTEDPQLTAQDWANELDDRLNAFYEVATRRAVGQLGMTTFRFVPVRHLRVHLYIRGNCAGSQRQHPPGEQRDIRRGEQQSI